jgi:hypothetical protein
MMDRTIIALNAKNADNKKSTLHYCAQVSDLHAVWNAVTIL